MYIANQCLTHYDIKKLNNYNDHIYYEPIPCIQNEIIINNDNK